jgi:hypothetical protein
MDMNNKLPITRMSKFLSQDDFDLNIQMGQEYLHGDLGIKLVLYRVDKQKTENDDVYAEVGVDEIKYFPPICIVLNFTEHLLIIFRRTI